MPAHETLSRRRLLTLLAAGAMLPRVGRAGLDGYIAEGGGSFTLSGATLLSHTGLISTGGVRVEGGIITAVGSGVSGGTDVGGAWIVPGFTNAGCTVGLVEVPMEGETSDASEGALSADARVVDGYNPLSDVVPVTRANGITTLLVHPGGGGLITGQAALLHAAGMTVSAATIQAPVGLCINLGRAGTGDGIKTRMGVAMKLRELLEGIKIPEEPEEGRKKRGKKKGGGSNDDDLSPADKALRQLKKGELMALIKADRVDDILAALELIATYGLSAALIGCTEGHLVANEIAAAGVGVLLGPTTAQPSSFQHRHAIYENPAILHRAGVRLALRSGGAHFARMLPTQAAVAVAHGLPFEAAIQALTTGAGEILGIEGLGRLEAGAPATIFLADGDPLQPRSAVQRMWIGGREASLQTRQTRLLERYQELSPLPPSITAPGPRP